MSMNKLQRDKMLTDALSENRKVIFKIITQRDRQEICATALSDNIHSDTSAETNKKSNIYL